MVVRNLFTVSVILSLFLVLVDCFGGDEIPFEVLLGNYEYTLTVDKQSVSGRFVVSGIEGSKDILVRGDVSEPEGEFPFDFLIQGANGVIMAKQVNMPEKMPVPKFREMLFELVFNNLAPIKLSDLTESKDGDRIVLARNKVNFTKLSPVSIRREDKKTIHLTYSAEALRWGDVDNRPWDKVSRTLTYDIDNELPMLSSIEVDYESRFTQMFGDGHYRIKVTRVEND